MGNYLFDVIIIVLLALFAWRGAAKGLVLSLCGLAAIFVAYFGAQFISDAFCQPVANIIRPIITQSFSELVPDSPSAFEEPDAVSGGGTSLNDVLAAVREEELFRGFSAFLEEGVKNNAVETGDRLSPADALAGYLAKGVARAMLFSVVFFGGLLAWFLFSHALDLAFKLPILAEVNLAGGLVVGLVKGVLFTIVLVWLGQVAGMIPIPPETPVVSLFTVDKLWELLGSLPA